MAQFPSPLLEPLTQPVWQAADELEIQPAGQHLDELSGLVFDRADLAEVAPVPGPKRLLTDQRAYTNTLRVTVSSETALGIARVSTVGRFGVSNPRPILLSSSPVRRLQGALDNPGLAADIQAGVIYTHECQPQVTNHYRVRLSAGQTVRWVVYSHQFDSRALPWASLFDEAGNELLRAHGRGAWPAEGTFTAQQDGDHYLAIRDLLYRGGQPFCYAFELAVTEGETRSDNGHTLDLELDRWLRPNLENDSSSVPGMVCSHPASDELVPLSASLVDTQSSVANALTPPFAVVDAFQERNIAAWPFKAEKGRAYRLSVQSWSKGFLTDPQMVLRQLQEGQAPRRLAENDDAASVNVPDVRLRTRDSMVEWQAPEDATYMVELQDLQQGARPADARQFRLTVEPQSPGFSLVAYSDMPHSDRSQMKPIGCNLLRGGTAAIRVLAFRRGGFAGAIQLAVDGLPEGIRCPPAIIAADQAETCLVLVADESVSLDPLEISIHGRAVGNDGDASTVPAHYVAVTHPKTTDHNAVQSRIVHSLLVDVVEADQAPIAAQAEHPADQPAYVLSPGANLKIPLKLTRREAGKVECILRPQNLPKDCQMAEVRVPADNDSGEAELKVGNNAPPGEYTLWFQCEAKIKWRANPQALDREQKYLMQLQSAAKSDNESAKTDNESAKSDNESANRAKLEEAIKQQSELVKRLEKECAPQDRTIWFPSHPIRILLEPAKQPDAVSE